MATEMKDYVYFEERCYSGHNRRCIDGKVTGCSKCVGYCRFEGHSGFLTERQRKEHDCIGKECFYYLPKIKQEKPEQKQNNNVEKIKNVTMALVSEYEGLKATKIYKNKNGVWLVKYISITNGYSIKAVETKLSGILGMPVKMSKVECDFEMAAKAIFG